MNTQALRLRVVAFATGMVVLAVSCLASADPPSRVIRLGHTNGPVSFSPAGEDDWVRASINRPLTVGDRLWVDSGARAELQIGGAVLRLNAGTAVTVLNLNDEIAQLQMTQGTMNVRVRRLDPNQLLEIDTPNLAFTVKQPGQFRIAVDSEGNATDVVVRRGRGEVFGEGASYVLDPQHPYRFFGTGLREYETLAAPRVDDFERWAAERDRLYDTSISARYVSSDVLGYQDLDAHGSWSSQPTYGNVWFPNRVESGWAPFRDGHWAWVDPWGWTWVDDAPWGFAVSHYGRWSNFGGRWGWVPGPVRSRAYYAPAVVAFVGGNNFQLSISSGNVGAVGWFPLGPREVYRPWYATSRRYFENVNVSNTVVNTTVVNNYYNNTNVTNVNYVNRQVPGAVVAVPTTAFVQSQPVARSAVRMTPQMVASAPVAALPGVAPTERSVRGAAAQGEKPPARVSERAVVARTAPAPTQPSFAAQQPQLQSRQGKPLDDGERRQLKAAPTATAAPAAPAPTVNVVAQPKAAPAAAPPPPSRMPAGMMGKDDRRGRTDEQKGDSTQAQRTAPGQVAQPGAAPQPERNATEPGKGQQRGRQPEAPPAANQAATPAPTPPKVAPTPPQAATPTAPAAQAPVARPPMATEQPGTAQQRGGGEQRGKGAERGRQPESAQGTPPRMASPELQPRVASPAQTRIQETQRPEQRKSEVPPQAVAPAPQAVQPPPQRSAQPRTAPPPQATPPAVAQQPAPPPTAQQPAPRPESTRQAERRAPEGVPPAARPAGPAPVAAASAPPPPQRGQRAEGEQPQGGGRGNNKKDKDKEDEEEKKKKGG